MSRSIIVVIPAYRPDDALIDVVRALLDLDRDGAVDSIVVVDDGSGVPFAGVFAAVREMPRVRLLTREVNAGKGAVLKFAIAEILSRAPDAAGIVTADADGQHAPADILRVVRTLADKPDHLVLGVRRFDRSVPLRSRFGNIVTRRVFAWRTGVALQDTQTGLRGVPLAWCDELLRIPGDRYEWELVVLMALLDRPIVEVPIETIYAGRGSHFNPLRDSLRIYRAAAQHALGRSRPSR